MATALLPFSEWVAGTLQNSVPANNNALRSEVLSVNVISDATTAQPGSPADGDCYIVPAGATGAQWATFAAGSLAYFRAGTWYEFTAYEGLLKVVAGEIKLYNGSSWEVYGGGGGSNLPLSVEEGGVEVSADVATINFTGSGVSVTETSPGVVAVEISGGGGGGASLTRATLFGGQTAGGVIFLDDAGLRTTAEGSGGEMRTARCALARGPTGKWYFECLVHARGDSGVNTPAIGVCQSAHANMDMGGPGSTTSGAASWAMLSNGTGKYHNGSIQAYGSAWANGDVIMVAVDLDSGKIWWGRNGTWFDSGNPVTGANAAYTNLSSTPRRMRPGITHGSNSDVTLRLSSSSFSYTPPSGFSAWA